VYVSCVPSFPSCKVILARLTHPLMYVQAQPLLSLRQEDLESWGLTAGFAQLSLSAAQQLLAANGILQTVPIGEHTWLQFVPRELRQPRQPRELHTGGIQGQALSFRA